MGNKFKLIKPTDTVAALDLSKYDVNIPGGTTAHLDIRVCEDCGRPEAIYWHEVALPHVVQQMTGRKTDRHLMLGLCIKRKWWHTVLRTSDVTLVKRGITRLQGVLKDSIVESEEKQRLVEEVKKTL